MVQIVADEASELMNLPKENSSLITVAALRMSLHYFWQIHLASGRFRTISPIDPEGNILEE